MNAIRSRFWPTGRHSHRDERGQVLVIVAGGLLVFVAMVGLVLDGGHAWGQDRKAQNGVDSVVKAGTVVVQHHLAMVDTPTDGDVGCAVEDAAAANGVDIETAEYADWEGNALATPVEVGECDPGAGTAIPAGAQGIRATATIDFPTFIMRVVGIAELTARADAVAVVGTPQGIPGGALPVTFPLSMNLCDETGAQYDVIENDGDPVWEPYELIDEEDAGMSNLALVPLCDTGPGSVGWLNYECGQNLQESIQDPCEQYIPIPSWVRTQTGNPNCCEALLNSYAGPAAEVGIATDADKVIALPIHNNTCKDPVNPYAPPPCPAGHWSGSGDNTYYHAEFWIGFKVDQAYTAGGDPECKTGPGQPVLSKPIPVGKVSCLKGWFVEKYEAPGPVALAQINPGDNVPMAIQLIN